MDAVSDALRAMRMDGALYLNAEFTAPWCVLARPDQAVRAAFLPDSERVIAYHLIVAGSCFAQIDGDPASAIHLEAGEVLVIPHGHEHILGSTLAMTPVPSQPVLLKNLERAPGEIIKLSHGGGGTATIVMCGFLAADDTQSNPLLAALPPIFKIDMRNDPQAAWLQSSLQFAAAEAAHGRPGGTMVVGKLSELLFADAVRRCIDALPPDRKGWLAGMRDRFVGRALTLMHAQPAHAWTVDALARSVGLSRSLLARRFSDLLGDPPMQYLTRWRLQIAAQELRADDRPLAAIAVSVGYESEAAFSRAFKRAYGLPPASWRKSRAKSDEAPEAA